MSAEKCSCQLPAVNPSGLCWHCRKPREVVTSNSHPAPWRIEHTNVPLADTGDYDGLTKILAADGDEVAHWWNADDVEEALAERIVQTVNAHETKANPLAKRCYAMSEPHLGGYRLVIGFEKRGDCDDAHEHVALIGRGFSVETPAELTEAEQLLKAWADMLPPNGQLYFEHTKRAREYFERRAVKTSVRPSSTDQPDKRDPDPNPPDLSWMTNVTR